MAGNSITTNSSLQCPHGGTVQVTTSNASAQAASGFIALLSDEFIVAGCPFMLPTVPPTPSPCVIVRWMMGDLRLQINSTPTLSQSSVGMCYSALQIPQGPPIVVNTQTKVQGK